MPKGTTKQIRKEGWRKKREKSERYYMGKEDVDVVAATLAPPSPYSTLPSVPSFAPSHMEEEVGVTSLPKCQVGDTASSRDFQSSLLKPLRSSTQRVVSWRVKSTQEGAFRAPNSVIYSNKYIYYMSISDG